MPQEALPLSEPNGHLTIAHVDAEQGFSGGEAQVFLLMEGLRRRGHENLLLCPPGSEGEREARARGFEVRPVSMANDLDLRAVLGLRRELAASGADLAHLHTGRATWLGGWAARLNRLVAVTTRRQDRPVSRGWRTRTIYGRLVRRAVAISEAVARRLEEGGVPRERITLIRSAVDPLALTPRGERDELRRALELQPEEFVLLTLTSLVRRKGVDVLLQALARTEARAMRLFVAGDGPLRRELEDQAAELGLAQRVRFLGQRADKAELLSACDAFVLPSRAEGLGVAALEAMAAGRPVVASRVGGLGEAVADGRTGLLVEPGDPTALAEALARLAGDAELCQRLGAGGPRLVAERHGAESLVNAYELLYREVLAEATDG